MPATAANAKTATLASSLLLILVLGINNVLAGFNALVLLFQAVPLALNLPGIAAGRSRSAQWQCFVVLFFLVHGILTAFMPGRLWVGLAEVMVCLLLFVSAIIFVRSAHTAQAGDRT